MIKTLVRLVVFVTISLKATQYVVGGYHFDSAASLLLYIIGLTALYFFMKPLLTLISLPSHGVGFLFMSFLLTAITSYVLTLFISGFNIRETIISELIIFGFVLPSKRLDIIWSNVFSSLLISVLMWFFSWLCDNK